MKPTVTIAIPAYNEAETIKACITSILSQKNTSFVLKKIIVVNDGSTDSTEKVVKSFPDQRIECITLVENYGRSAAINKALRTSTSDYFFKIDADLTFMNKTSLESFFQEMTQANVDLMYCKQTYASPKSSYLQKYISHIHGSLYKEKLLSQLTEEKYLQSHIVGTYMLTKKAYKDLVIPEEIIIEDVYVFYAIQSQGLSTSYSQKPYIFFAYPTSWKEHIEQITRWDTPLNSNYFSQDFLKKYDAALPLRYLIPILGKAFFIHPNMIITLIITRLIVIKRRFLQHS